MADSPILFSAPMVRALLEGRKTQTRRIAKVRKGLKLQELIDHGERREGGIIHVTRDMLAPPRFALGDRLWVKERLWIVGDGIRYDEETGNLDYCFEDTFHAYHPGRDLWLKKVRGDLRAHGWPSIFMPRWASRLTLLVKDVRVERLQDISEADAIAEGVVAYEATESDPAEFSATDGAMIHNDPRDAYRDLWNSINGPGAWEANPWVVAVTFDVRKGNIDG